MAIRLNINSGFDPIPDLAAVLSKREYTIEGDVAVCPHCFEAQEKQPRKSGLAPCCYCKKLFHVRRVGRWSYVTGKKEFPNVKLYPDPARN